MLFAAALAFSVALAFGACGNPGTAGPAIIDDGGIARDGGAAADGGTTLDGGVAFGDGGSDAGLADAGPRDAGPPLGAAIDLPDTQWTFIDFPDSTCDEGTPTGVGLNKSTMSGDVLVYFAGGGACWDYQTCFQLNTSTHGPYGATQFNASLAALANGTIFDRTSPQNPFRTFHYVIVPYCTGDLHAGNADAHYDGGIMRHRGRQNVLAFAKRVAATFRNPGRVVVAGSSAGGFGALINAEVWRDYWPAAKLYVLDDSGPFLVGDSIPAALRGAWFTSWQLGDAVAPLCGSACRDNLAALYPALAARNPNARFALLASLQDQVLRTLFQKNAMQLEDALTSLANDVLSPLPRTRYFFVSAQSHTLLLSPSSFISGGTELWDWLTQLVTDAPGWASKRPPAP